MGLSSVDSGEVECLLDLRWVDPVTEWCGRFDRSGVSAYDGCIVGGAVGEVAA